MDKSHKALPSKYQMNLPRLSLLHISSLNLGKYHARKFLCVWLYRCIGCFLLSCEMTKCGRSWDVLCHCHGRQYPQGNRSNSILEAFRAKRDTGAGLPSSIRRWVIRPPTPACEVEPPPGPGERAILGACRAPRAPHGAKVAFPVNRRRLDS